MGAQSVGKKGLDGFFVISAVALFQIAEEGMISGLIGEVNAQLTDGFPLEELGVLCLEAERLARAEAREARLREKEARQREKQEQGLWGDIMGAATKTATRSITNTIGREIGKSLIRGVLGSLFGGRR